MDEKKIIENKSFNIPYGTQGFFEDQAISTVTITFPYCSEEFEHGVMVGLFGLACISIGDCDCPEINKYVTEDSWFWDTPLKELMKIPHKRYIVWFEQLEEYGVYIATDDIVEFISGVASCPIAFEQATSQNWTELKYIDTQSVAFNNEIKKRKDDKVYFKSRVIDLKHLIKAQPITITRNI